MKINSTLQQPDYTLPWQTLDVAEARGTNLIVVCINSQSKPNIRKGSGAVIEGGFVLTAAHVIADYTYVSASFV